MPSPWDKWVPGVLNKNQMKELLDGGFITSSTNPELDHSSMDLSHPATIRLFRGYVKPTKWEMYGPGYLLYEEYLAAKLPAGRATQAEIREESSCAHRVLQRILPEANHES